MSEVVPLLLNLLVLAGAGFHLASLFLVRNLIRLLPHTKLRRGWQVMEIFILFFFASYLGYLYFHRVQVEDFGPVDLLGPLILFFGAIFVLLVNLLFLRTTRDLQRIRALEQENITDPLLGVYNRRHLERLLQQEFLLSRRNRLPLAIMLIDIDHFKEVNDRHGHLAGDLALLNLVRTVRGSLRVTDQVARYGGDELVVMLPHTPADAALKLAEKLCRTIADDIMVPASTSKEGQWPDIRLTVSAGVAGLTAETGSARELFAQADQALYQAKAAGRNSCASGVA